MNIELKTLCTRKVAQNELAAAIVNELNNPELTPLDRVAICTALWNAVDMADTDIRKAGTAYCLQNNIGGDGKRFCENGEYFTLECKGKYDYAKYDDLRNGGKTINQLTKDLTKAKDVVKDIEKDLKHRQEKIKEKHPNMPNLEPKQSLRYNGCEADVLPGKKG